jgi:NADH-quinone oxidoreductase subunit G
MNAHLEVSELKPLDDPDSPMSYTMEGLRPASPTNVIPFFWSPGWNSVQSVNKYQEEVGGALRAGDPGVRLIGPSKNSHAYYSEVPSAFQSSEKLMIVPLYHIFGSEELSSKAAAVKQRVPKPYAAISIADADRLKLENGNEVELDLTAGKLNVPVKIDSSLPTGVMGIPSGLEGVGFVPFLDKVEVRKI